MMIQRFNRQGSTIESEQWGRGWWWCNFVGSFRIFDCLLFIIFPIYYYYYIFIIILNSCQYLFIFLTFHPSFLLPSSSFLLSLVPLTAHSLQSIIMPDLTNLSKYSAQHQKPSGVTFSYGTAGFRTKANLLGSTIFRVGLLASLRSQYLLGKAVGVMITASHNPAPDNGVKLIDPQVNYLYMKFPKRIVLTFT